MERQQLFTTAAQRIRRLKAEGKFTEAAAEIRMGLEQDPEDLALKTSLADLFQRQGRLSEGRILVEEVLARDPAHPEALSVLGDLHLKSRVPEKALDCYRQALRRDRKPYLILKTARALKELGRLGEALEELENALVVNPGNESFLKEKALVLNRLKRFDQALETFEKLKNISPDDPFVRKEILRLRGRNRPQAQVLKELQTVVGMDSRKDDAQVLGLLAQKLRGAGRVREAAAEYRRAADLEPGNAYFLKQEGFCHYRLGDYARAAACLAEAFRQDPTDYYARGALGRCYEALNDRQGWLTLLEEVSGQHPEHKFLLGIIKKVRNKSDLSEESGT
jgi:tetratricopeptide (TPR) repeat protein